MTKFVIGKGTVISVSVDAGSTFTAIGQLKTGSFTGRKADLEDVTNMGSAGATREYAPTLIDSGQFAISGVFDPMDAGQTAVNAAFAAQTLVTVKVQYPKASDQTTAGLLRTFTAYVTDSNLDAQFDKSSTFSATFKITGLITDTAGS